MPKMRKKSDLPAKPCVVCGRPFTWRKKWAKVWNEVRYCSDACRMRKHRVNVAGGHADDAAAGRVRSASNRAGIGVASRAAAGKG